VFGIVSVEFGIKAVSFSTLELAAFFYFNGGKAKKRWLAKDLICFLEEICYILLV